MLDGLNMNDLLEKAKEMQQSLAKKKEEAATQKVDVEVGAGMVKLTMNGSLEVLSLTLDPEIVDKEDIATLEDLIRSAFNEGLRQAKELGASSMTDMFSGMNLPDLGGLLKK